MSRAKPGGGGGEQGGGLGRNRISMPQLPHCFFSYQLEAGDDTLGQAQLHELGLPTFQDQQQQQQQQQQQLQEQKQEEKQQQQVEGSDRSLVGYGEDERRVRGRVEGWGSGQGPGLGVRPSRPSAGKDRHSKVNTSKGPRDRRVRLSVPTAMQFYDVQDRLGYDQPSKAVEWLIRKAKGAIDELAHLPNHPPLSPPPAPPAPPALPSQSASVPAPAPAASPPLHSPKTDLAGAGSAAAAAAATVDVRTESRVKARERARERAREKEARDRDRDREQRSASASASASDSSGHQSQPTSDCGAAFPYDSPYNSSGAPLMAPLVRMRQLSGGPLGGVSPVLPSTFCSSALGLYANNQEEQQQQQVVVEGLALARPVASASVSPSASAHCLWESSIPCLDAHPTRPLHEPPPFCSSMGPLQSTPVAHASYVPATLFASSRGGSLQLQPQPLPHFHQDGSKPPRHA